MNQEKKLNKGYYIGGGIFLIVIVLVLAYFFLMPKNGEEMTKITLKLIKTPTPIVEKFENLSQISSLTYLGTEEKNKQIVFDYYSNFLKIYCKVKEENLKNKTESFILKLTNFVKNKLETKTDMFELINDIDGGFYSGKKGDAKKYRETIISTFLYIVMNSNQFDLNAKKDILGSFLVIEELLKSLKTPEQGRTVMFNFTYDENKDVITFKSDFKKALEAKEDVISYNEFKDLSYNFVVKLYSGFKLLDKDLLNYNLCE